MRDSRDALPHAQRSRGGGLLCADPVLGGYANPIALDETIDAMYARGKMVPPELRCTSPGGPAVTPSAMATEGRHHRACK